MQSPHIGRNTSPLRTERLHRHWSQQELADQVGASIATIKRWERQVSVPGPYFRLKLTALFGKSEEELGLREDPSALPAPPMEEVSSEEHTTHVPTTIAPLWIVPYKRNPYFTGRDELFRLLEEHLTSAGQDESTPTRRVALTQTQALTGLGGIGKTQLAVEYAYRTREQSIYTHTLWVNAASEEAIVTSFTTFAALLLTFAGAHETNQQQLVNAIKQWLEDCPDRWLLIFDNADDLSLVGHYFPRYGNGSILLTTRAHAVGSLATSIEVDKMSLVEALRLLRRRAQRVDHAMDDELYAMKGLVETLDYFPLALEQAGAYVEETGCSFEEYLHLYHTHRSALLAQRGAQVVNYPDSVATTWLLSFEQVEQANPAATQLLHLCAFLAPDHIPEELLTEGVRYWPPVLEQAVRDPLTYNQVLQDLLRFSLVKRLAENHFLNIHRLVQVVQVERLTLEEQRQWAERIVRAVNDLFPRDPEEDVASWPLCQRYLEQVQACAMLIKQYQVRLAEGADVLDRAGTYLREQTAFPQAEALYQQALRLREQLLGAQHPDVADSLHNLGYLFLEQGEFQLAERYYQQALGIREEQLGVQHSETGRTLNALGVIYGEQGRYELAESYWQRALALNEKHVGADHPTISNFLMNLGILYTMQRRYELAESYLQRALAILEEQLGADHRSIAPALLSISSLYGEQGKYELAESCGQRALALNEKHVGAYHPTIAKYLDNLGILSYKQGRYELAERYLQRALTIKEEQMGVQHVETAKTLSYLAELYRDQHEYEQAELLFTRALAIHEHMVVGSYPDLATMLHDFARFHEDLGNLQRAATLYQRALTIREQVYGLHHLKTCETSESLQRVLHMLEHEQKEVRQNAQHLE